MNEIQLNGCWRGSVELQSDLTGARSRQHPQRSANIEVGRTPRVREVAVELHSFPVIFVGQGRITRVKAMNTTPTLAMMANSGNPI